MSYKNGIIQTRIRNESVDTANRTVVIEFSYGTKGKRRSAFGDYYEELEISEQAIDFTRLKIGAPFLAVHNQYELDAVIGVVEDAWIENEAALARIRFAKDEISERHFQKVVDGILKNVSVGYDINEWEEVHSDDEAIPTIRITKWTPAEISLVPIGFDHLAQIRSKQNLNKELQNKQINQMESNRMNKELLIKLALERSLGSEKELNGMDVDKLQALIEGDIEAKKVRAAAPTPTPVPTPSKKDDNQKQVQEAVTAERTRCTQIRTMVKEAGLNDDIATSYIETNQTIDQVRYNVELFDKHQKENDAAKIDANTPPVQVGTDNQEARREGIIEAVLHDQDSANFELTEKGRLFSGQSLLRMMEQHIGNQRGETHPDFVKRVMSSSDLPEILSNVANKNAQKRYDLAPKTYQEWTGKGTLKDYKESTQLRSGDIGNLEPIKENGEYEQSHMGEEAEKAQLAKYGVTHHFTDIMLINDDLDMIMEVARDAGVAQARLDNKLAYAALTSNPLMNDGFNVFSGDHTNDGTAGAIGETTFDEAFQLMRLQKTVDARDFINAPPAFLICGVAQETAAKKFLATVMPNNSSDVNVFSNSVKLVVDPAIPGNAYYFAANPMLIDTVKLNRLKGQENVRVASRSNWSTDAIELKLTYAVQAKAMDYRGLVKNDGQ